MFNLVQMHRLEDKVVYVQILRRVCTCSFVDQNLLCSSFAGKLQLEISKGIRRIQVSLCSQGRKGWLSSSSAPSHGIVASQEEVSRQSHLPLCQSRFRAIRWLGRRWTLPLVGRLVQMHSCQSYRRSQSGSETASNHLCSSWLSSR